jgi:hypothetical protein
MRCNANAAIPALFVCSLVLPRLAAQPPVPPHSAPATKAMSGSEAQALTVRVPFDCVMPRTIYALMAET